MANQDFKDLIRRTTSDKYCVTKHLILLKIQNMMDERVFSLMIYKFFDKETSGGAAKNKNMSN